MRLWGRFVRWGVINHDKKMNIDHNPRWGLGWKVGRLEIGQWQFLVEEAMLSEMMMVAMKKVITILQLLLLLLMMMMMMASTMIIMLAGTWQFQLII